MSRARTATGMALVLSLLMTLLALASDPDVGLAADRKPKPPVTTTVRKLAPGVKLTKIVDRRIPRRTYVLAVDPTRAAIQVVLSNDVIPGLERTSSMARRLHATAAVNGDFAVDEATCTTGAPSAGQGVVLAALPGTDEATVLRTLTPGETMGLTWSFGWPNVVQAIGGGPVLVSAGKNVLGPCTTSLCNRN